MRTSESIDKIGEALAKAQSAMRNPEKNKTANIPTKAGGKYSFNYADLPAVIDAIRGPLGSNGISHTFGIDQRDHFAVLICRLVHSSGQWFESSCRIPEAQDIKVFAGNLTYLRRYLLCALTGIAADEDTDGEVEHEKATYEPRAKTQSDGRPLPLPVSSGGHGAPSITTAWKPSQEQQKFFAMLAQEAKIDLGEYFHSKGIKSWSDVKTQDAFDALKRELEEKAGMFDAGR